MTERLLDDGVRSHAIMAAMLQRLAVRFEIHAHNLHDALHEAAAVVVALEAAAQGGDREALVGLHELVRDWREYVEAIDRERVDEIVRERGLLVVNRTVE